MMCELCDYDDKDDDHNDEDDDHDDVCIVLHCSVLCLHLPAYR